MRPPLLHMAYQTWHPGSNDDIAGIEIGKIWEEIE
jgi:hypothetical protein